MQEKPIRIGVFIPEFKWERMNLHQIKPETHGVELIACNLEDDLSSYDGILHKFTYQLVDGHENDVKRIADYANNRPGFIVIEPIDNIKIFVDRLLLQNFLNDHPLPNCVEYVNGVELDDLNSIPFPFPYILKPRHACGTPDSHLLHIVHDEKQLKDVINSTETKFMAFPFIQHNGVVFKVYSLAETIVFRSNGSIVLHDTDSPCFDSQKPLPSQLANDSFQSDKASQLAPSIEELKQISDALQQSTGVQLIGFDLLRRESDGKLCLVDFNYFPCFRGVEDVAGKLAQFIKNKVKY